MSAEIKYYVDIDLQGNVISNVVLGPYVDPTQQPV